MGMTFEDPLPVEGRTRALAAVRMLDADPDLGALLSVDEPIDVQHRLLMPALDLDAGAWSSTPRGW